MLSTTGSCSTCTSCADARVSDLSAIADLLQRLHDDQRQQPARTKREHAAHQALTDLTRATDQLHRAQQRVQLVETPLARLFLSLFGRTYHRDEARVAYDSALAAVLRLGTDHQRTADAMDADHREDFAVSATRVLATTPTESLAGLPEPVGRPLRQLILDARSSDVKTTLPLLLDAVQNALDTNTLDPGLLDALVAINPIARHVLQLGTEPLSPLIAAVRDLHQDTLTPTTRHHARKRIRWLRQDVRGLDPDAILQRLLDLDSRTDLSTALGGGPTVG